TDSEHLVVVGTGAQAPYMALGHCAVRPIRRVTVYGRHEERAKVTAAEIRSLVGGEIEVNIASALDNVAPIADIISCATSSVQPVLAGECLRPGTCVDLVGVFARDNLEANDEVGLRSGLFVDTYEGALAEAGDL